MNLKKGRELPDLTETLPTSESRRLYMKRWREENRQHIKDYNRSWCDENAEHRKAYMTDFNRALWANEEHQEAERIRKRFVNYRLTHEGFNALWEIQDGRCAICSNELEPRGRKARSATVDHNHATGEVRGILCRGCNAGIGNLGDDPEILQRAADYLMTTGHSGSSKGNGNG